MRSKAKPPEELKLSITPLIDVTFLLLVFFMCAMRFKTLERKVAAHLPRDRGRARTVMRPVPEPLIRVVLKRARGEGATRVQVVGAEVGAGEAAFAELDRRVRLFHSRAPEFKGEIDARAEVPHGDVVRAVDAFLKAGIEEIRFRGAPPPGRRR